MTLKLVGESFGFTKKIIRAPWRPKSALRLRVLEHLSETDGLPVIRSTSESEARCTLQSRSTPNLLDEERDKRTEMKCEIYVKSALMVYCTEKDASGALSRRGGSRDENAGGKRMGDDALLRRGGSGYGGEGLMARREWGAQLPAGPHRIATGIGGFRELRAHRGPRNTQRTCPRIAARLQGSIGGWRMGVRCRGRIKMWLSWCGGAGLMYSSTREGGGEQRAHVEQRPGRRGRDNAPEAGEGREGGVNGRKGLGVAQAAAGRTGGWQSALVSGAAMWVCKIVGVPCRRRRGLGIAGNTIARHSGVSLAAVNGPPIARSSARQRRTGGYNEAVISGESETSSAVDVEGQSNHDSDQRLRRSLNWDQRAVTGAVAKAGVGIPDSLIGPRTLKRSSLQPKGSCTGTGVFDDPRMSTAPNYITAKATAGPGGLPRSKRSSVVSLYLPSTTKGYPAGSHRHRISRQQEPWDLLPFPGLANGALGVLYMIPSRQSKEPQEVAKIVGLQQGKSERLG
ncbi:hypothetical protein DFH09DRAFT_1084746 [Mycena vulgaris]|nr:hypothetical protein DFH09DRAFT_1084746 [Mycena vulgaris]